MKILYLFHDLMNLYGDNGNIRYLSWILQEKNLVPEVIVDMKSVGDELSFDGYDLIYCGAGTESRRMIALEYLRPYKEQLKKAILEKGTPALFTGNSWTILGRSIREPSGTTEGLGLFDYDTDETNEQRIVQDSLFTSFIDGKQIVGFVNKKGEIKNVTSPLFRVETGSANVLGGPTEGFYSGNFFATYLTGPLLVKNPPFLRMLLTRVLGTDAVSAIPDILDPETEKAYETTLRKIKSGNLPY
ncbi:MAG: glutamine amidotransferase [Firmicutes bacterium]|nr:glutamine amidotransferase [Bacillota bacterium]